MFKQGATPVPINRVPALATALEVDPSWLMRLALQEYQPEILETISTTMGVIVTPGETEIIEALRVATRNNDPKLSDPGQRVKLAELAAALMR